MKKGNTEEAHLCCTGCKCAIGTAMREMRNMELIV